MTLNCFKVKYIFLFFLVIFVFGCIYSFKVLSEGENQKCDCFQLATRSSSKENFKHLLGVVVPFRDRFDELVEFVPYINNFLNNQSVHHKIFIINQVDDYRFNRASLINVGFSEAIAEGCDYIVMHDVDLLPLNPDLNYSYPDKGVFHIASPELHPRYHYSNFLGGILIITKNDFIKANGMSNRYWGWGLEDDEFFVRIKSSGIPVNRPLNITTGTQHTFRHIHSRLKRKRDTVKCFNQKEVTRRRDRETGLTTLSYEISSKHHINIDGITARLVNTKLHCNTTATPWCHCPPRQISPN